MYALSGEFCLKQKKKNKYKNNGSMGIKTMLSLFLYLFYKKTQKAYVINKGVILIIPKVDLLSTSLEVIYEKE